MARNREPARDGLDILIDRFIGDDPERVAGFREAADAAEVAQAVYDLRTAAGLTQQQLADRAGTTKSVISRLEDADYAGHSLSLLRRIGRAAGCRVRVVFEPIDDRVSRREAAAKPAPGAAKSARPKSAPVRVPEHLREVLAPVATPDPAAPAVPPAPPAAGPRPRAGSGAKSVAVSKSGSKSKAGAKTSAKAKTGR